MSTGPSSLLFLTLPSNRGKNRRDQQRSASPLQETSRLRTATPRWILLFAATSSRHQTSTTRRHVPASHPVISTRSATNYNRNQHWSVRGTMSNEATSGKGMVSALATACPPADSSAKAITNTRAAGFRQNATSALGAAWPVAGGEEEESRWCSR